MNIKRILLWLIGSISFLLLVFGWIRYNEGGPASYPINTGSFFTVGSATIDPTVLLENVRNGKVPTLLNVKSGIPDDAPFTVFIGWSQDDYLKVAQALYKVIWIDDPNEWHLYRAAFYTSCENPSGKFENADLYYYQEVKRDGRRAYSVRNILIEPESGYIAWGGDTFFSRPLWGWVEIDIEKIKNVPAEKALELADLRGGNEFRDKENNACRVSVNMWPWGYERSGWSVFYSGKNHSEIWIAVK